MEACLTGSEIEPATGVALWNALEACDDALDEALEHVITRWPELDMQVLACSRVGRLQREALVAGQWTAYVAALEKQGEALAEAGAPLEATIAVVWAPREAIAAHCRSLPPEEAVLVMCGLSQLLELVTTVVSVAYHAARGRAHHQAERWLRHCVERSTRDLDEFVNIAAHDLRAPLRDIDHLAQWLIEDGVTHGDGERHTTRIRQRVEMMRNLLDDLVTFCRVGLKRHVGERVDTGRLIDEVLQDVVAPPGFELVRTGQAPVISTGRTPLRVVLRNLVENAVKHHDGANGRIEVNVRLEGNALVFSVIDDGPGIPAAQHERVFRMFVKLRPADEIAGSGVGLALVEKLVRRQGGVVELDSGESGRGCTFRFTWPARWAGAAELYGREME